MKKRFLKLLTLLFLFFLLPAGCFWVYLHTAATLSESELKVFPGESLKTIALRLERNGLLRFPTLFALYAKFVGQEGKIQAGIYRFERPATPLEILGRLVSGDVIRYSVTFPEGWTCKEMGLYLQSLSFVPNPKFSSAFLSLCKSTSFARQMGIPSNSVEGYLFPDTYQIPSSQSAEELMQMMIERFRTVFSKEVAPLLQVSGRSLVELVTLASLVEKETGLDSERPLIAGIFYRRLNKNIPLQSDPTVIYGLKNFDGNLRKEDLKNPHPYNTYVHTGLSPGPIANPGLASLKAVAVPAVTDYLYFVGKGDGSHSFSRTLQEHARAVQQYQINPKSE